MALYFEIQSGPLSGKKYKIEAGLTVGRREGTILLEQDGKVSGQHAVIEVDNKDRLCIVDVGSSNGFVINDNRVRRVSLLPGVTFRVGETVFQVQEFSDFEAAGFTPAKTWRDHLRERFAQDPGQNQPPEQPLQAFTPALQLEFVEGPQAEKKILLAYGPRTAGLGHLDIDLGDPNVPENAFALIPGPGAVALKDLSKGKLLINSKKPKKEHLLEENDLISIGLSVIKVGYV